MAAILVEGVCVLGKYFMPTLCDDLSSLKKDMIDRKYKQITVEFWWIAIFHQIGTEENRNFSQFILKVK